MSQKRKRILLMGGLIIALAFTLFFGVRFVMRVVNRPTFEPIRGWMNIGYIARAYGVPPQVLDDALGIPPESRPELRPISEVARSQNRSTEEVIQIIEQAIAAARPPRPPPLPQPTR
jgi:hypothetical protein